MSAPIITEGLVRRFGKITAVDGIDLHIEAGEIFGFLGPNGAGKSTTVRMLTTLLRPSGGRGEIAGYDIVSEADMVRRSIGVALQDAAIDPLMTGRELVKLQSILHGIPRAEGLERGHRLLETVGLTGAADRRVGTYSGGMRRRLDLALALIHEPVVLFLDEPTTGLDPSSRATIWDEVRQLNREFGTTVFLTTQYMEEADQLAGRVSIIDNGKIVAAGTPRELKSKVGDPTLKIILQSPRDAIEVERILLPFGEPTASEDGSVSLRLPGGSSRMAELVRVLDDAKIEIESLELHMPTLDDVFLIATGRRLEGSDVSVAEAAP